MATDKTRANGGSGKAPGKGAGELGEYVRPEAEKPKSSTTPPVIHGFDDKTSQRIDSGATKTSNLFRNTDGSVTRRVSSHPVNYKAPDGSWQPIDTTLTADGKGRYRTAASGLQVSFAGNTASNWDGGALASSEPGPAQRGPSELVTVTLPTGEVLGYNLDGATQVTPVIAGSTAKYLEVLPHTDVEMFAAGDRTKELIVLHSKDAPSSWLFPLRLQGLTARQLADGSIALLDLSGKQVASIPLGYMQDSKFLENEGDFVKSDAVTYELVQSAQGVALKVTADRKWLDDPARVYPVRVDPTTTVSTDGDVHVDPNPNTGAADQNGTSIAVGWDGDYVGNPSVRDIKVSYLSFGDFANATPEHPSLAGMKIQAAWLNLYHTWTPSSACTKYRPVYVHPVSGPWTVSGLQNASAGPFLTSAIGEMLITNNYPACTNAGGNRSIGRWVTVSIQDLRLFNLWSNGVVENYGLGLSSSGSDSAAFKRFTSENYGGTCDGRNCQPYFDITYAPDTKPQLDAMYPSNSYSSPTLTPELLGAATDAEGDPLTYKFRLYDLSGGPSIAESSNSASRSWMVPAGTLRWGQSYAWSVVVSDGIVDSVPKVHVLTATPPQPLITSNLSQNSGRGIEPSIGNFTTQAVDANIANVGPPLSIQRSYNSRDSRKGSAFGLGWSSILDAKVTTGPFWAMVTYPDGQDVVFGRNDDGSYASPPGRFATLRQTSPGQYELIDKQGMKYRFSNRPLSQYVVPHAVLMSIEDTQGREVALKYYKGIHHVDPIVVIALQSKFYQYDSNGARIAEWLGRKLDIAWTGSRVASVSTERADAADPGSVSTWSYTYSGEKLVKVCPPTSATACTQYEYGTNWLYPTAALDAGPHTYLRLGDASGPATIGEPTETDDAAIGVYHDVALGQAAPTGSLNTAATFNGTSSWVELPDKTAFKSAHQTVAMWFKVPSGGSGVLYSASTAALPQQAGAGWNPMLYVGTDGKLRGEMWMGSINPITTAGSVADGLWHHVALSVAGSTQILYLDGVQVGEPLQGTVQSQGENHFYIGAGQWDWWNGSGGSTFGYFNGSIADFSFYTKPLTGDQIRAMRDAGIGPSSPLTRILRPSGAVQSQIGYDSSGVVAEVIDENGERWTIHPAVVSGTDSVYAASVLSGGPSNYWRLGDTGTPSTAKNEVNGGVAEFSSVTLGEPGPFQLSPPRTAAKFNGTSSYLKLPDREIPQAGANSVSMWFKADPGTHGVLFSYQSAPLSTPDLASWYTPAMYVGTDGKLWGQLWTGGGQYMTSPGTVNDGKWHHAVLSASTTSQALYLDGTKVGSFNGTRQSTGATHAYVGAGKWQGAGGAWPSTSGTTSYFPGWIAEVAFYQRELNGGDASAQFAAYQKTTGAPTWSVIVTDPAGKDTTYRYDALNARRLIEKIDPLNGKTVYGYDSGGFLRSTTDPNGNMKVNGHDVRGNVVSQRSCQDQSENTCSTTYYTYYPDATTNVLSPDPRNDLLLTVRDGRSESKDDNTYLTTLVYDSKGNRTALIDPYGRQMATEYTDGSGGVPAGLPKKAISPGGGESFITYLPTGDVKETLDAAGQKVEYTYDGHGRRVSMKATATESLTTTYAYDKLGRGTVQTDPPTVNRITSATHTRVTETTYDSDGHVVREEVRDSTGGDAPRATSYVYTGTKLTKVIDPQLKETRFEYDRFGRVSKQFDANAVGIELEYDDLGNQIKTTILGYTGNPNSPLAPDKKQLESRQYDAGSRLAAVTDAEGYRTEYVYTDNGLLAQTIRRDPTPGAERMFTLEVNAYDAAGNLKQQITNNGVTVTDVKVDRVGRPYETVLDPAGAKRKTTYTYTPESDIKVVTISDASAASQTTESTYDIAGRKVSETIRNSGSGAGADKPAGWWKLDNFTGTTTLDSTAADRHATATGDVSWPSGSEGKFNGGYVATSGPVLDTNQSFTISAWAKVSDTGVGGTIVGQDANWRSGFELYYAGGDNWGFVKPVGDGNWGGSWVGGAAATTTDTWMHVVGVYDRAAGVARLYVNGNLLDTQTAGDQFAATGALTIGRGKYGGLVNAVYRGHIDNVQVYQRAVSTSDITALRDKGRHGGSLSTDVSTSWSYDKRGNVIAETNANGQVTDYEYDAAGRRTLTKSPAVTVEEFGTAPATGVIPMSWTGYDTFGGEVSTKDPKGRVVTYVRDANGRVTEARLPADNGMNPVYKTAYDGLGRVVETQDPRLKKTSYTYDQVGRLAKIVARDGGQSTFVHDMLGRPLSAIDPSGAENRATYDFLGRRTDTTEVVRQPTYAEHKTTYTYHNVGQLKDVTSPSGIQAVYGYNNAGDLITARDSIHTTTEFGYDFAGRMISAMPKAALSHGGPLVQVGVKKTVEFDVAGRPVAQREFAIGGSQVAARSATYDNAGNMLTATDFRGYTTQFSYDATGLLTQQVEPLSATDSITTKYGYDIAGAKTSFTDGRNNQFWSIYNNWGLQDKQIEPATAAFPNLSDRTHATAYDIAGRPATQTAPGGVTTAYTYDDMDRVTSVAGSGAEAATADRTFGYDAAGRVTALSGSGGSNALTYDDRGLLLSATGPSGNSSFTYNSDGLVTSRVDAAGITNYSYNSGLLTGMSNADTGVQNMYTYTPLGQVKSINYATNQRTLGYDERDRLTTDELKTGGGGATVAKITYGWDANNNLTSKNTTGFAGSANNTYGYDRANRLTSWNNGASTVDYAYDKSGNRTKVGSRTFTYDERNRLLASPSAGTTYLYTARGTLRSSTTGTVALDTLSDAFDQVTRQYSSATAYSEYTYDGLGRAIKPGFSYTGLGNDLASDGTATYTRDPAGRLEGVKQGSAKTNVWLDQHSDVVGQFTANGTTLAGSATYDPLGKVLSASGMTGNLGYQSEWTDLGTGRVNMHARWYNPDTGQFDSRDSWALSPNPASVNANRYSYANQNPLIGTDPSGHNTFCGNDAIETCPEPDNNDPNFVSQNPGPPTKTATKIYTDGDSGCGGVFDCFWEGLKSTFSISLDDLLAIWNAIKNLGETFKGLEREAKGWGKKIRDLIKEPLLPQWITDTAGWVCLVTGACEILSDCVSLSAKCMYHVGAAVGEAVLGILTAGAAAAGLKVLDRVRDLAKKLLNKRDGKDENGNPPNSGSNSGSSGTPDSNWDIKRATIDDRLDKEHKTPAPKTPEPPKPPKKKPTKDQPQKDNGGGCANHSFDSATPVLMADGTAMPIEDVEVGDEVLATDPETGESGPQPVTLLHVNLDEDLIDVTVSSQPAGIAQEAGEGNGDRSTRGPTTTLHTTQHHPFWDATTKSWVNAADLDPGKSTLVGPDGQIQHVAAVQTVLGFKFMRDLTVATVHTYYVLADDQPVLVHNCDGVARFVAGSDGEVTDLTRARFVAGADGITDTVGASNSVSIGRFPGYVQSAQMTGARTFNIGDAWTEMVARTDKFGGDGPGSEVWIRNSRLLDQAIARGSFIRLASNPFDPVHAGTFFMREIVYLQERGYTIGSGFMAPPA